MLHREQWNKVLSQREFEVALLVAQGSSNKQVARELGVCEGTVKLHVRSIFRKVGASSRHSLIGLSALPSAAALAEAHN
jgi:DNA-binding NarL/FixJ family response regulator